MSRDHDPASSQDPSKDLQSGPPRQQTSNGSRTADGQYSRAHEQAGQPSQHGPSDPTDWSDSQWHTKEPADSHRDSEQHVTSSSPTDRNDQPQSQPDSPQRSSQSGSGQGQSARDTHTDPSQQHVSHQPSHQEPTHQSVNRQSSQQTAQHATTQSRSQHASNSNNQRSARPNRGSNQSSAIGLFNRKVFAVVFGCFGTLSLYASLQIVVLGSQVPFGGRNLQLVGVISAGLGAAYLYAAQGVWSLDRHGWTVGMWLLAGGTILSVLTLLGGGAGMGLFGILFYSPLLWILYHNRFRFRPGNPVVPAGQPTQSTTAAGPGNSRGQPHPDGGARVRSPAESGNCAPTQSRSARNSDDSPGPS